MRNQSGQQIILADLEGAVEDVAVDGRVAVIVSADSDVLTSLSVAAGKSHVSKQDVSDCVKLARKRSAELDKILLQQL